MSAKTRKTRLLIAGSCVNVELHVRLSFNEMEALRWALKSIDSLIAGRVVGVPDELDKELTHRAIGCVLDRILIEEPNARKQVIAEAKLSESEAAA